MATWTTNTTSTDEAAPSTLQAVRDKFLSLAFRLIVIMLVAIVILAETCSVPKFKNTNANPTVIRQEMDNLIRSGSSKEIELHHDRESNGDNSDMELYQTMMALVTAMKYGDFELQGAKAQEFWAAYAPAKADTTLEYIRFRSAERHVLLRYSNGIAVDVTMEFDQTYLYKATTLNYGTFNGNPLSWLWWRLAGRFISGYPCYVSEAALDGNGIRGDVSLRKYTLRNQFLSWKFPPSKHYNSENVTGHWLYPSTENVPLYRAE